MSGKHPKRIARPGVDEYGRTPLHYAASEGDAKLVGRLLAEGSNPNAQDDNGWCPLHFAAQAVCVAAATALIDAGANVTLRDRFGNTPLFRAVFCSRGDGSVIRLLRSAGADPDSPNESGVTPRQLAQNIANFDVAQFLTDRA